MPGTRHSNHALCLNAKKPSVPIWKGLASAISSSVVIA